MGSWGIGLAVLGVGVIGEWLLGPKSKNTADLPAGVPALNQALRGTTIPITFGTNRVDAQITWTNNFRAVRQKGGGKGKGGGSGGFGGAKGGSGGAMYEYYWDLMFHYGIFDKPSIVRRAWIGGDNVDQDTISAITAGLSETVIANFPIVTNVTDANVAQMNFQEAFFAPGFGTDADGLESWPHMNGVVGAPVAFPYTLWLGFEQLDLGMSPSVPQLQVEAVPADITLASDVYWDMT